MTIYFIQASVSKHIKIGFTEGDPASRLKSLQTGNHQRLTLIAHIPGGNELEEHRLHAQFRALRAVGEWFTFGEPLQSFIRNIQRDPARLRAPSADGKGWVKVHIFAYWARSDVALAWLSSTGWNVDTSRAFRGKTNIPTPNLNSYYYDLHDVACENRVSAEAVVADIRRFSNDNTSAGNHTEANIEEVRRWAYGNVDSTDHEA